LHWVAIGMNETLDKIREAMPDYVIYRLGPFDVPNVAQNRGVRVFLPPGAERSGAPVLVMFDGQNVFNDEPSYAGGWHLHKAATKLQKNGKKAPAVIAIDHGNDKRIDELGPFANERSKGLLDPFLDWIAGALLPRVTDEFGLAKGPEHTAIGGSSMGGLAALYAHFKRPETFGGVLSMSPSLWFGGARFFEFIRNTSRPWTSRVYLDGGVKEGRLVAQATRLAEHLKSDKGYDKNAIRFLIDRRGRHSEIDWRRRAPVAIRFLYRLGEASHNRAPLAA
jgi:predicted alpha/beta superfamily hydrolase